MTDLFNSYRPILSAMPLRDALAAYLTGGLEWSQTQAGLAQFFIRAAYRGDPELAERFVRPIGTALREMAHEMLARAVKRGEIRADIDLEATARIINALLIAVGDSCLLPHLNNYFQVVDDDMPLEQILDALFDLILHGIGAGNLKEGV